MENSTPSVCGCVVRTPPHADTQASVDLLLQRLGLADLQPMLVVASGSDAVGSFVRITLSAPLVQAWAPCLNTLGLAQRLELDTHQPQHLLREILITMAMAPVAFEFPSLDELESAIRIRVNVVLAGRKTTLAFGTAEADRPPSHWLYDEDRGFVIRPGVSLIDALMQATQPQQSGALYSFSCYRASEYVILLGIAQEIALCNPALYAELQQLWREQPIKSGKFHDVFLREQGTMDAPLPARYFVPGDRTWFRNPDSASADASGFEGSWVMYLGDGLFNNFWKQAQPYSLTDKCLEIYHWRHGVYLDAEGEPRIDEAKVARLVEASRQDANAVAQIEALMQRYREPRGVYTDAGGCMDTTREFARWVRPGTADLVLPRLP